MAGSPLLIAHRGGAGLAPENTLASFRNSVNNWGADMLDDDPEFRALVVPALEAQGWRALGKMKLYG